MDVTVLDMMNARDRRAEKQRELLGSYGQTLLCFTMNIPGPEKDNALIRRGFALGRRRLRQGLLRLGVAPVHAEARVDFTGCEAFYVLAVPPLTAKRMACDIEEADALGRLFDMDVLRPDGDKVERREIGLPGRKCLLCGETAQVCARARTHTVAELRARTAQILREAVLADKCETVARLACTALMHEVLTTPKPGLVDRANNGSHRDMDVFTFAASTAALHPYFAQCARIGAETAAEDAGSVLERLRLPGRMAEGEMLSATGGVNTHKGAIFSIGILCAAAGRLDESGWRADGLLNACAAMAKGLVACDLAGLTAENATTFGQRLYLERGMTGVRGEAERGFPLAREHGYPTLTRALSAGLSINDAGRAALIALMARNDDTNLIHRGGIAAQQAVAARARQLLAAEEFPSEAAVAALDAALIRENLSPGGSADLLALCYLLLFLEKERESQSEYREDEA